MKAMNRAPLPPILYLVVRDYGPDVGIGSPDVIDNRDTAYDVFTDAIEDQHTVAVWEIATHDGIPVSVKDATDSFETEVREVCIERGLDLPDVRRFQSRLRIAAE